MAKQHHGLPQNQEEVDEFIDEMYVNEDDIVRSSLKGIYRCGIAEGKQHLDAWRDVLISFLNACNNKSKTT